MGVKAKNVFVIEPTDAGGSRAPPSNVRGGAQLY
jgi:hypothetical protein